MTNPDLTKCPGQCFRPAGLAFDAKGRLWMSSDTTGELFVLEKKAEKPTTTASGTLVTAPTGKNESKAARGGMGWGLAVMALAVGFVGGMV